MLLLALLGRAAEACSPAYELYGFDGWVDGATEVPTDARVMVWADGTFDLTLTRLDTLEVLPISGQQALSVVGGRPRVAYTPRAELAAGTSYQVDVTDGDDANFTATFTTGEGPTDAGFDPPVIDHLDATGWKSAGEFLCSIGNPVVARTVTASVELPDDLPVGSYVALRSSPLGLDHASIARSDRAEVSLVQGEHAHDSAAQRKRRDCLTPLVVLPSGDEVVGDEVCLGSGCSTGGSAGFGPVSLVLVGMLAGVRSRRR